MLYFLIRLRPSRTKNAPPIATVLAHGEDATTLRGLRDGFVADDPDHVCSYYIAETAQEPRAVYAIGANDLVR